jgi:cell pole-organizing protein PopZ
MEEILASIRRIISDDESSTAKARTASASQQDDEGLEAAEGEADDRIINDIARVLSGSASAAEDEEDILDLTAELGGLEPIGEPMVAEVEVIEMVEMVAEAAPAEAPPQEVFQPAPARPQAAAAPEPVPQPEVSAPVAPPLSASEEAATALERAIAALRAGHVPTSVGEFMPPAESQPEPLAFAPEPEPAPEPEQQPEPEPDAELVLTEFEADLIVEELVAIEAEAPSEPEESVSSSWDSDPAPWARAPEPLVEPERPAARTNGGAHGQDASHKTLEDSVRDMLRPMLRQWLDENMPRMVTAALKDELGDSFMRGQGD